eukprot:767601-Hanusia_phi.AAC.2
MRYEAMLSKTKIICDHRITSRLGENETIPNEKVGKVLLVRRNVRKRGFLLRREADGGREAGEGRRGRLHGAEGNWVVSPRLMRYLGWGHFFCHMLPVLSPQKKGQDPDGVGFRWWVGSSPPGSRVVTIGVTWDRGDVCGKLQAASPVPTQGKGPVQG